MSEIRFDDIDKESDDFIEVKIKQTHVLFELFDAVTWKSGEGTMIELSHDDAKKLGTFLVNALEPCPECDGYKRRHNCYCKWHPSHV